MTTPDGANAATGAALLALFGALWTTRLWRRGKRRHAALVAILASVNAMVSGERQVAVGGAEICGKP